MFFNSMQPCCMAYYIYGYLRGREAHKIEGRRIIVDHMLEDKVMHLVAY